MNTIQNTNNINFSKVYRKVLERDPYLIHQILPPNEMNNVMTKLITGKTNTQINNPSQLSEIQKNLNAIEFERLIQRQKVAQNRSGNVLNRLMTMEKTGYQGICKKVPADILHSLTSLKKETISALNDFQLYRICEHSEGTRKVSEGIMELEKEFTTEELQRLSERDNSTIINTWINKQINSQEGFENLTKYIHQIARK